MYRSAERTPEKRAEFRIQGIKRELLLFPSAALMLVGTAVFVASVIIAGEITKGQLNGILGWFAFSLAVVFVTAHFQYFGRLTIDEEGVTINRWRNTERIAFAEMHDVDVHKHVSRNNARWEVRITRAEHQYVDVLPDPKGGSDGDSAQRVCEAIREAFVAARGTNPWEEKRKIEEEEQKAQEASELRRELADSASKEDVAPAVVGRTCAGCGKKIVSVLRVSMCPDCDELCHEECLAAHREEKHAASRAGASN